MGKTESGSVGIFSPRLIRLVACVVLIALLPLATGCYGSFPLTHIIYQFNGEVTHSDLVHSIVFWVFIIIPVYWVGLVGDFIVLNLIEFWTGEKMTVSVQTLPDGSLAALEPSADGKEAALTVSRDGKMLERIRFVRVSGQEMQVFDEAGHKVGGVIRTASSGLALTDAQGATVVTIGAGQISQFREAIKKLPAAPAAEPAYSW